LFAERAQHFDIGAGVDARIAVLNVDDADDVVLRYDGRREKRLEAILRKFLKELEARIAIGFARDRQQAPLASDPPGQTFTDAEPHLAEILTIRVARGAQDELIVLDEIDQAGVAGQKILNQVDDFLQHIIEAHVARHKPAYTLEQTELLLGSLEAQLKIPSFRHRLNYHKESADETLRGEQILPRWACAPRPGGSSTMDGAF